MSVSLFNPLAGFRTRHQPYMVRQSYLHELRAALTYPLAASLAEGSFTGVVAAKYFQSPPVVIALISAAPMFGNILAMVWSELSRTRRKVRFVNCLQLGVVLLIAAAGLTSFLRPEVGRWTFAALIIGVRLLASGILTVRTEIWRCNYPRAIRGRIIARLTIVSTAVLVLATMAGSRWLDHNPAAFVYLYPAAGALGAIGIYQFSRIRVRMESSELRRQQQRLMALNVEEISQTDESGAVSYAPEHRRGLRGFFGDALGVLRHDKVFRTYQRYQFLSGFSFMLFAPSLLYMVSKEMTNEKRDYMLATFILQIIPMVLSLLATPFWGRLFDRMHITRYRVIQTSVSVAAQALLFVGAWTGLLWVVALSQVVNGITAAGGALAWNLGHTDFAPPEKAGTYMGVHVMLTGLRGCIAPFLGAFLYTTVLGRGVFLLAACICAIALLGFISMARKQGRPSS